MFLRLARSRVLSSPGGPDGARGAEAAVDAFGLHMDGAGDFAQVDMNLLPNWAADGYANDAHFAVSFWCPPPRRSHAPGARSMSA